MLVVEELLGAHADESDFVQQYKQTTELVIHCGVSRRAVFHQCRVGLLLNTFNELGTVEAGHVCTARQQYLVSSSVVVENTVQCWIMWNYDSLTCVSRLAQSQSSFLSLSVLSKRGVSHCKGGGRNPNSSHDNCQHYHTFACA